MRAAAAALLGCIAVAAYASAAPAGLPPISPGPAAAAGCVPVQHSKRVVKRKKVRRHGKLVKVKRRRTVRWTTCEPPAAPPCENPAATLGVTADDLPAMTLTLSRPCVTAGSVAVQLVNEGEDPHTLAFRPAGTPEPPLYRLPGPSPAELDPGLQASDDIELTPGDWYLWCDVFGHEGQGMNATLLVR